MSRRSELLKPVPARTEDCFAQFDAVFNSLATQLQWTDVTDELIVPAERAVTPVAFAAAAITPVEIAPQDIESVENDYAAIDEQIAEAAMPVLALVPRVVEPDTNLERQLDEVDARAAAGHNAVSSGNPVERFGEAFDKLDTELAQSDVVKRSAGLKALAAAAEHLPPVFEVDSSWFGEGVELQGVAPPPVQQVRLAPSPIQLRNSHRAFTGSSARRQLPGGRSPLENVLGLLETLSMIQGRLGLTSAAAVVDGGRDAIVEVLNDARQLCVDLDLQTAGVRADFALATLEGGQVDPSTLREPQGRPEQGRGTTSSGSSRAESRGDKLGRDIEELVRHIRHDLQSCAIWPIATSRVWALNLTFGPAVNAAFPSAQADVAEGGICFGLARFTACVFHMLRAAEQGLSALALAADAKAPLQQEQRWGALIAAIETRARQIDNWPRGQAKTRAREFFTAALDDANVLKESARKLTAGSTRPIDEYEALSVCNRTRDLLVRLSERINEAQDRTLGKQDFAR